MKEGCVRFMNGGYRECDKGSLSRYKGAFPNDDALFKSVYLAVVSVTRKWTSKIKDWPLILAELSIHFEDRIGGYL